MIFFLTLLVNSCYNASFEKNEYLLYEHIINSDSLKIDLLGTYSIKTEDFVYNRIQYSNNLIYVIIELKNLQDLNIDSVFINNESNIDVGFSRFSNTISYNRGFSLEHVTNFKLDSKFNFEFQDVSKIDTIFRDENLIGFIYSPMKLAITNRKHKQQMILNDSYYRGNILCLLYKEDSKVYLIQVKPTNSTDVDFSYIETLNFER